MAEIIDGKMYYTIRFLNYAGTDLLGTCQVEEGGDATLLAPTPEEIEGKVFKGWNVDITNVMEDMTVRPVYEDNLHTVRFLNKDDTDILSIQQVEHGGNAVAPVPPKEDGFIFIGWNTSFFYVVEDITVRPVYRAIPPNPVLTFYKKNADNTTGNFIKAYTGVNACSITQKLSGECTISVKILTRQMEGFVVAGDRLEVDGLVFNMTEVRKTVTGGMCYTEMNGEHISYILNEDMYKVTAFDMAGKPKEILATLLSGTPFTVGTVDSEEEVTLRVNRETTRRACIMQLIALMGCEIEYYGFTIGIRTHVGATTPIDIMKMSTVQDISYSFNASEQTTNYSLEIYDKGALSLGDKLNINFSPFGIADTSRIVGMEWNPFNYREVSITVGDYIPTLNDSIYQLISSVQDIRETSAKYTVEFGEMIGNGTFYFTRAYLDRPYFHVHTSDGSQGTVTLNRKDGSAFSSYVGAKLTGVNSNTVTVLVFYCTVPDVELEG